MMRAWAHTYPRLLNYGVAVASTGAAAVLGLTLDPIFQSTSPYVLFFLAIIPSAILGGWGPGLLAVLLGTIAGTYLFVPPYGRLDIHDLESLATLLTFVVLGVALSGLGGAMKRVRRRAEEQAERLSHTLENMAEGYLVLDRSWRVLAFNRSAEKLLHKQRGEVLGRDVWEQFPGARELRFGREGERALREGREAHYEEYYPPLDLWLEVDVYPAGDNLSVFMRDITERKHAAQVLEESEVRFRGTFENAALGITHTDTQGRLIRHNQKLCDTLGYTREELEGKGFRDLTYPEDIELDMAQYEDLWAGRTDSYDIQKRYLRKDGKLVWVEAHRTLQRDASGHPLYAINVFQDITARKQAEAELEAARRSADRAKAAAEEASRAKDRFLATLSHELRTPITPVLAAVSMLQKREGLDALMRHDLELIRRNIELEARLIDDLLDLTRIARGKIELDKRPVDLCTIVQRAVEVCRPDIEARELNFEFNGPPVPYLVEADAARLQQVFWNLLKNAIKFTPHGGWVGVRCDAEGDRLVQVEVSDSGVGIEAKALERIFDAFEQGERSTTRQFGGLGLGLAISKSLVELHGGAIEARSPGRGLGATIQVKLPLLACLTPGPKAHASEAEREAMVQPKPALCLLLVEDHGDTAEMMQRMLEAEGHRVTTAGDVASALALIGSHHFDMLISDLGLPDGSGLDLMRDLRARGRSLPCIALSGYGQEQDIRESHAAGFAAHVVKPVDMDRLLDAMDKVRPAIASHASA